jgi:tetratricopeptide (TPR) repeat protein
MPKSIHRAAKLIRRIVRTVGHVSSGTRGIDTIIPAARAQAEKCARILAEPNVDPDLTALLCAAFAKLLLTVPIATERDRLDRIIAVCSARVNDWSGAEPSVMALAHVLLGEAYFYHHDGSQCDDAHFAIRHFEAALWQFPAETDSATLGSAHHNLGVMYTQVRDYCQAVHHCELANALFPYEFDKQRWALIQSDLGLAYLAGEGEQIETGIGHLLLSLQVFDRAGTARFWAHAQERLGIAFERRTVGNKSENLDAATRFYANALLVFSSEAWPSQRALVLQRIGRVHYSRSDGERERNLSLAIKYLEEAKSLGERIGEPQDLFILGRAYFARRTGHRCADLRRAVDCFHTALARLDVKRRSAAIAIARRELTAAEALLNELKT